LGGAASLVAGSAVILRWSNLGVFVEVLAGLEVDDAGADVVGEELLDRGRGGLLAFLQEAGDVEHLLLLVEHRVLLLLVAQHHRRRGDEDAADEADEGGEADDVLLAILHGAPSSA
jgi:hypothetical protein